MAADKLIVCVLLAAICILLLILFDLRRKLRVLQKNLRDKALQKQCDLVAQDLKEELGSGLTTMRLLTSSVIAKQANIDSEIALLTIEKIAAALLDQLSEGVWLLDHPHHGIRQLMSHLRLYMAEHLQHANCNIKLNFTNRIADDFSIDGMQRRNILFVSKEIFHNAIKHSGASLFTVECTTIQNKVIIMMKDNGIGLSEENTSNTNGLTAVKKRIAEIQGKITFERNSGTLITIEIQKKMTT